MVTPEHAPGLRSADLKANLSDIQDNVVTPILMRYGRHVFVKFTDGPKARAFLGKMFQRAVAKGDGSLEDQVDAFLKELAEPAEPVLSDANVDPEVDREWQYETVAGGH